MVLVLGSMTRPRKVHDPYVLEAAIARRGLDQGFPHKSGRKAERALGALYDDPSSGDDGATQHLAKRQSPPRDTKSMAAVRKLPTPASASHSSAPVSASASAAESP